MSVKRLQRWLDRLSEAIEHKKWALAVAETDCLSAELRIVREELCEKAELSDDKTYKPKKIMSCVKIAGTAMLIICLCSIPISVESGTPRNIAALPTGIDNIEFTLVSAEEKELLQMLRANLRDSNIGIVQADKPETTHIARRTGARKMTPTRVVSEKPAEFTINPVDMLTLIQIGERSLRGTDTGGIKIIY